MIFRATAILAALSLPASALWAQDAAPATDAPAAEAAATPLPVDDGTFRVDDGSLAVPAAPAPVSTVRLEDADSAQLQALILDTLAQHPDLLVDALTRINAQQLEARKAIAARELRIGTIGANAQRPAGTGMAAPVTGNPSGDLTIVAFVDPNCAPCHEASRALDTVAQEDGKIRVIHALVPFGGAASMEAAKASLAVAKQGKYPAFHAKLLANDGATDTQALLKVALESGVDLNRMLVEQEDAAIAAHLADNMALAKEFGIEGAPAFFVGMLVASGAPTQEELRAAIARERERARNGGTPAPQASTDEAEAPANEAEAKGTGSDT